MASEPTRDEKVALLERIRELENRLEEYEETLGAIRRGEIDAVVVNDRPGESRIYTLETADRPYRVLIEQMQEGAVTLEADGIVIYCNRRLAQMLGIAQERVVGHRLQHFLLPEDVAGFETLLSEARHAGTRSKLSLRSADGNNVPVHVSLSVLHDNDTTLLCGVLTDLTAQMSHMQALADANARLSTEIVERERVEDALRHAQKMEAIGALTGGIAHDFNNMLQAVTSGITLAKRRLAAGRPEKAKEMLDAALMAAERTATLTRRLLAFGRPQALDPKRLVVADLIHGISSLIQRTVGPAVKVTLRMRDGCWPVRCDPNQLENALLNLAINARDAMLPSGGRLTIETGHVTFDEADTGSWEEMVPGDYVRITVTDTGTGIAPEVLAHIFEPFFTTKPDGKGTGLGLSQVYGFVRQSKGAVRLESALGAGTSARIYLPRCHDEPAGAGSSAAEALPPQPARATGVATVLLVDDETITRKYAAETLRELGYRVITAADGPEGLKALRGLQRQEVRLLVTDIGLPGGINGRQLAEAARELFPDLPI